jgi:hypothetical protein
MIKKFILTSLYGLFEGIWRRWFGGYFEHHQVFPKWLNKIMESRGTQTVVNILFLTCLFMTNTFWLSTPISGFLIGLGLNKWVLSLIVASIFQFMFWSLGHGPAFDMARGSQTPDEKTIERYHREKWSFIPDKIFPQEHWYGFLYDFVWMLCRYTYGAMFIVPFMWSLNVLWLGLIITCIYSFCWTIQERDSWVFKLFPYDYVNCATNLAEVIGGFAVGIFLSIM